MKANRPVVDLLERIGQRKGARPGQIALAWLLARKPWIVPIPGTTKRAHLDENLAALDIELTPADLQDLESGYASLTIQGARSSEAVLALIDTGSRIGTSSKGGQGLSAPREK